MTSSTLSNVPQAIASSVGRFALKTCKVAGQRYMATPLASTGILMMTCFALAAANNALFQQNMTHPAPLFYVQDKDATAPVMAPAPTPNPPIERLQVSATPATPAQAVPVVPLTQSPTVSAPVVDTDQSVSNAQLASAQQKLSQMGLFSEKVDGFYGPKTAEAIRAFELRNGLPPKGALEPTVINLILRANPSLPQQTGVQTPQPSSPVVVPTTQVTQEPTATQPIATSGSGQDAVAALLGENQGQTPATAPAPLAEAPSAPAPTTAIASTGPQEINKAYIEKVQRALASLVFLQGQIDGVAGESTAKAIRSFEVFNNYEVTGRVTPELLDLLLQAGATIN